METQVQLVPLQVPDSELTCANAPPVPPATATDNALAAYITDLWDAGADCRAKLGAVRGIIQGQQKGN